MQRRRFRFFLLRKNNVTPIQIGLIFSYSIFMQQFFWDMWAAKGLLERNCPPPHEITSLIIRK